MGPVFRSAPFKASETFPACWVPASIILASLPKRRSYLAFLRLSTAFLGNNGLLLAKWSWNRVLDAKKTALLAKGHGMGEMSDARSRHCLKFHRDELGYR